MVVEVEVVVVVVGGERHSPAAVPWRVYIHTRMTPHPPSTRNFSPHFPRKLQSLSPVGRGEATAVAAAFSNP